MVEFAANLISQIGLIGAALLIAIEVIVLPIPSEMVLLLTGFNASLGEFSFMGAIAATTFGSLLGGLVLYLFGFGFSKERVESIISKWGKYVGITNEDLDKTFDWFERYGTYLVFFGRLFPIIRSLVSIPAGLVRMSIFKFALLTTAGSAIWNTIWISLGALLGEQWERANIWTTVIDYAVYLILGTAVAILFFRLWRRRKYNHS
ncbi:MAG: DedA family protein [Actinobacteria bacterium]|nr:DedA family protein [Actinomycetota bacterium]